MQRKFFLFSLLFISGSLLAFDEADAPKGCKKAVPAKIGVVEFQDIIDMENPEKSASLEWGEIIQGLEKKLKPAMEKIQNMQAKLQKQSKEAREQGRADEETAADLMKLEHDLQIDAKKYQSQSQKMLAEAQAQFGEKVQKAAKEVAQEQGWTHVMPGPMIFVDESCNITKDVVERLNKNYREEMRKKKFAAQKN